MSKTTDAGCACDYPYLGAQMAGTPLRCERCRLLVLDDGLERMRLVDEESLRRLREWGEANPFPPVLPSP